MPPRKLYEPVARTVHGALHLLGGLKIPNRMIHFDRILSQYLGYESIMDYSYKPVMPLATHELHS